MDDFMRARPFRWCRFVCAAGLGALAALAAPGNPGPGLMITPSRVVLDARRRNAELQLSNAGTEPATYRISLIHMEMDETGQIRELPLVQEPGQVHPQELIRFSPKEVTLAPREWQTVRVEVRKPPGLPDGEYRINMVFRLVPPPESASEGESAAKPGAIAIKLNAIWGLAVPLIVRQGETSAQAAIVDPVLDPSGRQLGFRVALTGNQSVFGDITATFHPRSGPEETLARLRSVAVYPRPAVRVFNLPLAPRASGAPLAGGRLVISYAPVEGEGGKAFCQQQIELP